MFILQDLQLNSSGRAKRRSILVKKFEGIGGFGGCWEPLWWYLRIFPKPFIIWEFLRNIEELFHLILRIFEKIYLPLFVLPYFVFLSQKTAMLSSWSWKSLNNSGACSLVVSNLCSEKKGSRFKSGSQLCAEVSSLQ